ncbi:L-serine ammonia-lyase, iron-sulfur-dependent, subunit beta [Candidatus Peregrinibacteria bacterium]|nr:L-serine ammonia-lyase, iron-sulfur-dependent, subunit beta [Candidatus Peregrinibacteria bacterium]
MSQHSIFDIAGPIMVGPSSSHTAGACKIGQFARALFHGTPKKVTFYLHGSFGEVYHGHATDRALLGGVMKFKTRDERMKESFDIANQHKLEFHFVIKNLGEQYHPNTVKIVLENIHTKMSVIGSSIGGGMIKIVKINEIDVNLKGRAGRFESLVIGHEKKHNLIERLKDAIEQLKGIEVVETQTSTFNGKAISILSLQGRRIILPEVLELEKMEGVEFVRSLHKLEKE